MILRLMQLQMALGKATMATAGGGCELRVVYNILQPL